MSSIWFGPNLVVIRGDQEISQELLWLSRGNGEKILSLFIRTHLSFSMQINFYLTEQKRGPFFRYKNRNFSFSSFAAR